VNGVSLVVAHVLDHFGVGEKFKLHRKRPGLSVGLGIVDCDFNIHVAEVVAAEALDGVKSFSMRAPAVVEPALVVEAAGVKLVERFSSGEQRRKSSSGRG
jgi:hypothetical protein